jgi:hypothetical protein
MTTSLSGGYGFYYARNFAGYEFFTGAGGGLNMDTGEGTRPAVGQWTHVVGVSDGGANISIYVNGYLVGTANNATTPFTANPSAPFYIGCRRDSTLFYNGAMGDVAFYNYMLSPAQIRNHATIGLPLKLAISPSPLVITDSKPVGTPYDGLNNGAAWQSANSDGTTTRNGVMQFTSTNATGQITGFGYPSLGSTNGTIMFWMRTGPADTTTGSEGAIVFDWRSSSGLAIAQHDTNNGDAVFIQAQNNYNHFNSVASPSDNKWHHIAITYDQGPTGFVMLFFDGAFDSTALNSSAWSWPVGNMLELGRDTMYDGGYWETFNGALDDFRMYNRILTTNEIDQAMGGAIVDASALQIRYNFNTAPGGYAVTWPYGSLMSTPAITNSFSTISNVTSPFPVSPQGVQRYFRGLQ